MTTLTRTATRFMTSNGLRAALVAGLAASFCFPAAAGSDRNEISVEFAYNEAQPVAETYDTFERIARDACRLDSASVRGLVSFRYAEDCQEDLVEKAVHATGFDALIEHHSSETGATRPTPTLMSR